MKRTARGGHTSKKFTKEAEEKDRAAEEEENQVGQRGPGVRSQVTFSKKKISAIHVDPEALIQGGEGARWMKAFSNALLPLDPKTPQPGRPGTGLGSRVP